MGASGILVLGGDIPPLAFQAKGGLAVDRLFRLRSCFGFLAERSGVYKLAGGRVAFWHSANSQAPGWRKSLRELLSRTPLPVPFGTCRMNRVRSP